MVDENLEYGDFRVETRTGAADGRLATRMGEVHESLLGLGEG
jgi:flagellar biosynthesis/type III secretory pathway protein FliH